MSEEFLHNQVQEIRARHTTFINSISILTANSLFYYDFICKFNLSYQLYVW